MQNLYIALHESCGGLDVPALESASEAGGDYILLWTPFIHPLSTQTCKLRFPWTDVEDAKQACISKLQC